MHLTLESSETIYKKNKKIRSITNSKKLILINNTVNSSMETRKNQSIITITVRSLDIIENQFKSMINTDLLLG